MGITLKQFDSLAGGAARGIPIGEDIKETRAARRDTNEANDRTRVAYEKENEFRNIASARPIYGQEEAPQQAPPPAGGIPAQGPQTFGYGENPVDQGALPTGQAAPPAAGGPSPLPAAGGSVNFRGRYQSWYQAASNAAFQSRGIEGLKLFEDREMEVTRRQALDYTRLAVEALGDGAASTAAKHMNDLRASAPIETGIEWVARDGKLFARRGVSEQEYSETQLFDMQRKRLATIDTWAALLEQFEKERSAKKDEEIKGGQLAVDESAETRAVEAAPGERELTAAQAGLAATQAAAIPEETDAKTATALAALNNSQASMTRAEAAQQKALEDKGWSNTNIIAVTSATNNFLQNQSTPLFPELSPFITVEAKAKNDYEKDVQDMMYNNDPGTITPQEASEISQIIRGASQWGVSLKGKGLPDMVGVGAKGPDGEMVYGVKYNGKTYAISAELAKLLDL